jgi:hypothetical protein
MNLSERVPNEAKELLALFKHPNGQIFLKGSAVIGGQVNYSDYDFFSKIKRPSFTFFKRLLKILKFHPKLYFIELKFQDDRKIRFKPGDDFDETDFNKALQGCSFIKVDIVSFINTIAIEASSIYSLKQLPQTQEEYRQELESEIKELKAEGNYYKVLKRMFSLYRMDNNEDKVIQLLHVFNSPMGDLYKVISSLQACQLVSQFYDVDKLVKLSIKELRLPVNIESYQSWMNQKSKELNSQAEKILKGIE